MTDEGDDSRGGLLNQSRMNSRLEKGPGPTHKLILLRRCVPKAYLGNSKFRRAFASVSCYCNRVRTWTSSRQWIDPLSPTADRFREFDWQSVRRPNRYYRSSE